MGHQHFNGLKTAGLFGVMWVVILGLWAVFGRSASTLWIFVAIGLVTTAYGYWNSDKIAIRAMRARPVSELEQPAMYRIVRGLSDRKSTRLNSSHTMTSRMPSSA